MTGRDEIFGGDHDPSSIVSSSIVSLAAAPRDDDPLDGADEAEGRVLSGRGGHVDDGPHGAAVAVATAAEKLRGAIVTVVVRIDPGDVSFRRRCCCCCWQSGRWHYLVVAIVIVDDRGIEQFEAGRRDDRRGMFGHRRRPSLVQPQLHRPLRLRCRCHVQIQAPETTIMMMMMMRRRRRRRPASDGGYASRRENNCYRQD
mmetsp:Transcript_20898/g.50283  ORF Transcript_20898/g.50283 Transcript_20898/m.50283 type:complete len:200 (+) Transcript_20898:586-1185(+)